MTNSIVWACENDIQQAQVYDDDDDQQDKVYVDCVVQAPEAQADCGLYTVISAVISCTHHSRHHLHHYHHHHHHHNHHNHQHYITTTTSWSASSSTTKKYKSFFCANRVTHHVCLAREASTSKACFYSTSAWEHNLDRCLIWRDCFCCQKIMMLTLIIMASN